MNIFKKFWRGLVALAVVIGSLFIMAEMKRRKTVRAISRKKLDKLAISNVKYTERISNLNNAQNKLDMLVAIEKQKYNTLQKKKRKVMDKMSKIADKKKKQTNKINTLDKAIESLEARYAK